MKCKESYNPNVIKSEMPSGVQELMEVYKNFQKAYATTERYLELVSPKTHQTNNSQSFLKDNDK